MASAHATRHFTQGPHAPHVDHPAPIAARLTGPGLLSLQLLARGYSHEQVARLLATFDSPDVLLDSAARKLGAHSLPAVVAEAKRRRLID